MSTSTTTTTGRREWIALAVLTLPTIVLSMDLTVLHLAAAQLSADLAPTGAQLLWILDIYGFMIAGFLLIMGPLGDRIGRRRLLMVGAAAFATASVLAAFAPSPGLLIASRALLGIAGATLMPSTLALITDLFPSASRRTFAIAVWMTAFTAGEALGPLIGGLMLEFFWWGSVFLIAVPVMVLVLVLGPPLLPESKERLVASFDIASTVLLLAAALPLIYGVKTIASHGLGSSAPIWLVAGLVAGTIFVRRQLRSEDPLMDVRLFRRRAFGAGVGTQMLAVFAMAGSQLLVMQHLQAVLGLSPLAAGLWSTPSVLAGIAATLLAPRAARVLRPELVIGGGLLLASSGAAVLALTSQQLSLGWTVIGFSVLYVGVTPTLALTTDLIVAAAPRNRSGMASSVAESAAEMGLAAGIAVIGIAASETYRSRLLAAAPDSIEDGLRDQAGETVGQAVTIAEELPSEVGTVFLDSVRTSFAEGLAVATAVSSALLIVGAWVAFRFLGARAPGSGRDEHSSSGTEDRTRS